MINNKFVTAVIAAAGSSSRMKSSQSKQLMPLLGVPVLARTVGAFTYSQYVDEIIIVCPADETDSFSAAVQNHVTTALPIKLVQGSTSRLSSVWCGVSAANAQCEYIVIHDGARPLVTHELIDKTVEAAVMYSAVTAAVPVKDTIKVVSGDGTVTSTPNRDTLRAVQTPQAFAKQLYVSSYQKALADGAEYTDDCRLVETVGAVVRTVEGDFSNIKVTTPDDITLAEGLLRMRENEEHPATYSGHDFPAKNHTKERTSTMRIGHGYYVHRLCADRKLIIGGVDIPYKFGLLGHSDADVLAHAVTDALLGASSLGDIGGMFPDTDPRYEGADSIKLLNHAVEVIAGHGFSVSNIDATVIAQRPKLKPYIQAMRENIAAACNIDIAQVNIKATTEENLGFTGREEGIAAPAVALLS